MSIYQNIFDIIHTYIYGGGDLTPSMELVCTLISTYSCMLVVLLPFIIMYTFLGLVSR